MPTAINSTHPSDIDGRYAWIRLVVSMLVATIGGVGMWAVVVVLPEPSEVPPLAGTRVPKVSLQLPGLVVE